MTRTRYALPPTLFEPVIIIGDPALLKIDDTARVDSFVKIEVGKGVQIGKWVHVSSFAHINIGGGVVYLGEGCGIASGGKIVGGSAKTSGISMSAAAPTQQVMIDRGTVTRIGRNAVVGINAVVLPGVTLGDGAILAAGGVATCDIPPHQIWGGVPARFIRMRTYETISTDLPANG